MSAVAASLQSAERALAAADALRSGGRVLLVDDAFGLPPHVVVAASRCDAVTVAFMARHARGVVSLGLSSERCDRLGLRTMGRGIDGTVHTVSIQARDGIVNGISAKDRARTIAAAVAPANGPLDVVSPGHVFPLRASPAGTCESLADAAVGLSSLADQGPAAVLCAVLDDHGDAINGEDVGSWSRRFGAHVVGCLDVSAALGADHSYWCAAGPRRSRPWTVGVRGRRLECPGGPAA